MSQQQPANGARSAYAWVGQQVIGVVIASGLSMYVATKVLDSRVSSIEIQLRDTKGDLKDIAESVNKMAVSFAELSTVVKEEIRHGTDRAGR